MPERLRWDAGELEIDVLLGICEKAELNHFSSVKLLLREIE